MWSKLLLCLFAITFKSCGQMLVAPPGANELEICIQARMYISQYSERYGTLVDFPTSFANVEFGSHSRKMSNRLNIALQQFVTDVETTLNPSYVFQVIRTFEPLTQWPPHSAGAQDLFYEGRAIDLRFGTRSSSGSISYGAAPVGNRQEIVDIAGGVADYASFTNGSSLHMSVAPDGCEGALDLAFLVDGSGSITEENWPTATGFLEKIANFTSIAPDKTRVAVTTFSSQSWTNPDPVNYPDSLVCRPGELWTLANFGDPAMIRPLCRCCFGAVCTASDAEQIFCGLTVDQFNFSYGNGNGCGPCENPIGLVNGTRADLSFDTGVSRSAVLDAIKAMTLPDGGTWTARGLDFVREHVFTTSAGMRPLSDGVPRVLVVMTDGDSHVGYAPADAARAVRNAGVTVIALRIGVTSSTISSNALAELRSIASADSLAIVVPTFSALAGFTTQIDTQTCFACTNGPADTLLNVDLQNEQFQCFSPCGAAAGNITEVVVTALDGSATVYLSQTRYGGSRNNTVSVSVLSGTTRTLTWPGSGFVIFYGTTANTKIQISMQTASFSIQMVQQSVVLNASVEAGASLINLATLITPPNGTGVEYQFLSRIGSDSNFTVLTSGEVRAANAVPQPVTGNSSELVRIRATPVSDAACSADDVTSLGTVYEFEVSVTVLQVQPQLASSDDKESGSNIGAIFGILIFLCVLLLLALFVLKKRREAQQSKSHGQGTVNPLYGDVKAPPPRPLAPNIALVANESYQQVAATQYKPFGAGTGADHEYGTVLDHGGDGSAGSQRADGATANATYIAPNGAPSNLYGAVLPLGGANVGESTADDTHYGTALGPESNAPTAPPPRAALGDSLYTDIAVGPGAENQYADIGDVPASAPPPPSAPPRGATGPATYEEPVPGTPHGYKKFKDPQSDQYADAKHLVSPGTTGGATPYADARQLPAQPRPDGTMANETYVPVNASAPPPRPGVPPVARARDIEIVVNTCYTSPASTTDGEPQMAPPTRPSDPPAKAPPARPPRPATGAPTRVPPPKPTRPSRPAASGQ